jgi:hypothetical protein
LLQPTTTSNNNTSNNNNNNSDLQGRGSVLLGGS